MAYLVLISVTASNPRSHGIKSTALRSLANRIELPVMPCAGSIHRIFASSSADILLSNRPSHSGANRCK